MPTSQSSKRIVALTMGDPGGIGPEVTLKALDDPAVRSCPPKRKKNIAFLLIGSPEIYIETKKRIRSSLPLNIVSCVDKKKLSTRALNILDVGDDPSEVAVGRVSLANAVLSFHSLEVGAYLTLHKVVNALVTAPINKKAVQLISPTFTGHTEYLAHIAKVKKFGMMFEGGPLRLMLVTTHLPLARVPKALTSANIVTKIELLHTFLRTRMKIRRPRITVAGLNPHAGEGGKIGREEIETIAPAIHRARNRGIAVSGPLPADVVFHDAYQGAYDGIICMYHDQALGPFKMVAFHTGVNITVGLPFIRTSPDHGTAFTIAHKNKAHPGSMKEAIKTALRLMHS